MMRNRPHQATPTGLFMLSLCIGLGVFLYVYGFKFDVYSEEQLLLIGPLWLAPLSFGLCGLLAEPVVKRWRTEQDGTIVQATLSFARTSGFLSLLVMFPFLLLPFRSVLKLALGGCAFWLAVYFLITRAFWHLF